jgi:ribosomal-protein-alanine N-acetyltransferase
VKTSTIEIRPMRWWDIAEIDKLERDLFPHDSWSTDQWWRELAQPHNHYVVYESSGVISGYAGLSVSGSDADIQTIAVGESFQGQGIGRHLLGHLVDLSVELKVTFIFLEVRDDNSAALSLYSLFGFKEISKRVNYYPDGTDALVLRRDERENRS